MTEDALGAVFQHIADERKRQDERWGTQNHSDFWPYSTAGAVIDDYRVEAEDWKKINALRVKVLNDAGFAADRNCAWDGILLEEVYEALSETDPAAMRAELVQVAAVCAAWIEAIDRRGGETGEEQCR